MAGESQRRLDRRIDDELESAERAGLRRQLRPGAGVDFSSNDYLGLASDARFRSEVAHRVVAASAAGEAMFVPSSRLLRGQTVVHARVESRLATWKSAERALVLPSGWQACAALLSSLPRAGDILLSDQLNHAALIDGMRASRAERIRVQHLDLKAYTRELDRPRGGAEIFVVVESHYSMEGDLAPLGELSALCRRFDAHLLVDEAHAVGIYGAKGSGWIEECGVERDVVASVVPFGKALAVQGAAIVGSRRLIELLVQRSRPFVYSTAVSPLLLIALEAALDVVLREPQRRAKVHANARRLRARLTELDPLVIPDGGPIVSLLLGDDERTMAAARKIQLAGFDVRGIRPPTVPEGTARLRISVHADHSDAQLDGLAAAAEKALA
jgi:8-amino-7-oxononanoate synthase